MPLGRLGQGGLTGRRLTYQPFPDPPSEVWNAEPVSFTIHRLRLKCVSQNGFATDLGHVRSKTVYMVIHLQASR